jgi:D-alanyl-D-alanine carboxypeptidase (penicillin-binding protein 5/6)
VDKSTIGGGFLRATVVAAILASSAPAGPPRSASWVPAAAGRRAPPEVSCASCIVVADGGRVLWSRAPDVRRANASTTKMATALVTVAAAGLDEEIKVSASAAGTGGGGLDLRAGDVYSVEELLYALLLTSSNDAAVALAERVGGGHEAFVAEMNRRLPRWGAIDTHFVTAHGLDTPGHFSTAEDLALIGRRLLHDPELAAIVATPRTVITGPEGAVEVENRNLLLETYRGAIGIKTGYTASAGNVLVAAARRHRRTVVAVAMGSADATADARALLDEGFARLRRTRLLRAGDVVGALYWPAAGATAVVADRTVRGPYDPASVEVVLRAGSGDGATAGQVVGAVVVRTAGRTIAVVDAVATDTVDVGGRPWIANAAAWLVRHAASATGRL